MPRWAWQHCLLIVVANGGRLRDWNQSRPIRGEAVERLRALSIRQPYAEQILRGTKTTEYRSRPTRIRGKFLIYAALTPGPLQEFEMLGLQPGDLPTGVLVGTADLVDCTGRPGAYEWHLRNPVRRAKLVKPKGHPQPVWFNPF